MKKIINLMDAILKYFIIFLFVSMVLVGGLQVFNRFILNQSLSWSEELQRYLHIWIVFFTIPLAYKKGLHIGMTSVREKFTAKVKKTFDISDHVLWLSFGIAIIAFSQKILVVTARQTSSSLGIKMNIVYSGMVISAVYLVFVAVRKLINEIAGKEIVP